MTFNKFLPLGLVTVFLINCLVDSTCADIRLPKMFSDSMVLQRQVETPLYGVAEANEELMISVTGNGIEKKELKTVCDAEGNFSLKLPAPPVGGPYELVIEGTSSTVRIRDILVGDVWLCSGQSNMEMSIGQTSFAKEVADAKDNDSLRLMTIEKIPSPRPLDEFTGAVIWSVATAENAEKFSAVGYHFGQQLQSSQQVPIGLIHSSWGGTLCEAWTSQTALQKNPKLSALYEFGQTNIEGIQKHDQHGALFNGMISPLRRFPIKGVIWYQGESNVGRGAQYATLFPTMINDWREHFASPELPFLFVQLAPYRYSNHTPQALAEVWDAQLKTLKSVHNTGMAVTTDIGNFQDIHPQDKKTVGQRLALWAEAEVYNDRQLITYPKPQQIETAGATGQPSSKEEKPAGPKSGTAVTPKDPGEEKESTDGEGRLQLISFSQTSSSQQEKRDAAQAMLEDEAIQEQEEGAAEAESQPLIYSGPIYRESEIDGRQITLHFYAGQGLKSSDGEALREFQMAGEDQVFHPAKAVIVDQTIVVTCDEVQEPVAVRFAFRDTPEPNLVNEAGLPASPFRTDLFPLRSAERDY